MKVYCASCNYPLHDGMMECPSCGNDRMGYGMIIVMDISLTA